ncbi:MAG TPA: AEC family transporter [Spirochaetota bacterium]|nr:AEC family transporter [Spirochaetota bacterium]
MSTLPLILPLFLLIFLGYFFKKTGFLTNSFREEMHKLVYYITLPALLFKTGSGLELGKVLQPVLFTAYPIAVLITCLLAGLYSFFLRPGQRPAFIQGSFRSNLGYLGVPLVIELLGEEASGYAAVILGVGVIINSVIAILLFSFTNKEKGSGLKLQKLTDIVKNPLIIAITAGFIFSMLRIPLPGMLDKTLTMLAELSLTSILILIGLSLSFGNIKNYLFTDLAGALLKMALMPLTAYWLLQALTDNVMIIKTGVLLAAMPTAVVSFIFAKEFKSDTDLTISMVNFNTLAAIILIPLTFFLLNNCTAPEHRKTSYNDAFYQADLVKTFSLSRHFTTNTVSAASDRLHYVFTKTNKHRDTFQDVFNHIYFAGDTLAFKVLYKEKPAVPPDCYYLTCRQQHIPVVRKAYLNLKKKEFLAKYRSSVYPMERVEHLQRGYMNTGFSLVGSILEKNYAAKLSRPFRQKDFSPLQTVIYLSLAPQQKIFFCPVHFTVKINFINE